MFNMFKKTTWQDQQKTVDAILELSDKWWKQNYERFFLELASYHDKNGKINEANAAISTRENVNALLSKSLEANTSGKLSNKAIQEAIYVRVAEALRQLEEVRSTVESSDLPFKDLIIK